MEHSEHVLLTGEGAMAFCRMQGLDFADAGYLRTERRRRRTADTRDDAARHGTVGAVARDAAGHLAVAPPRGE
jgi:isoaspartyl peptidase/L-asparaginase-like protein (Ntn-hydrolase superfamily)